MASSGTTSSPFERFARNVASSAPRQSRRDLLRSGAVISAATALGGGAGVSSASAQAPTRRFSAQDDIETDVEITLPFNPFGLPVTLDPHRAPNWGPLWVLLPNVWSGLLAFDELGAVIPDLAEAVIPNETANVWTATLKPDLAFASGNAVTAQSFVDSWLRALDPQLPAPMASFMELVKGFDAYIAGESDEIGFAAIDESTIEITLAEAFSSFPASLATFVWAAVDLSVIDDPEVAEPLLAGAGAGLWQFTEFVDGDQIVMTPNENSSTPPSPSVSRVVWQILDGPGADSIALDLYNSDTLVSIDVPATLMASVQGDDTLAPDLVTIESQSSTMAIGMDFSQEPFGDLRVRRAVAAAIDREAWANEIWSGEFVAASGVVPPVVALTSGYEGAEGPSFEPDAASALLVEAGIDAEANMPDIVYYQPASDSPDYIERHAALLDMISENSGLAIRHDATLTADQIAAVQGDTGGVNSISSGGGRSPTPRRLWKPLDRPVRRTWSDGSTGHQSWRALKNSHPAMPRPSLRNTSPLRTGPPIRTREMMPTGRPNNWCWTTSSTSHSAIGSSATCKNHGCRGPGRALGRAGSPSASTPMSSSGDEMPDEPGLSARADDRFNQHPGHTDFRYTVVHLW